MNGKQAMETLALHIGGYAHVDIRQRGNAVDDLAVLYSHQICRNLHARSDNGQRLNPGPGLTEEIVGMTVGNGFFQYTAIFNDTGILALLNHWRRDAPQPDFIAHGRYPF